MKLKSAPIIVILPLTLFLINVFLILLFFKSYPHFLIANQSYATSHQQIMNYLFSGNDLWIRKFLDLSEYNHIKDVRNVILGSFTALIILITVSTLIMRSLSLLQIKKITIFSMICVVIIGLSTVFLFEPVFILFHKIFFPQGNWSFPIDSTLIQLYPENFWITTTTIIFSLTMAELIGIHSIAAIKDKTVAGGQEAEG